MASSVAAVVMILRAGFEPMTWAFIAVSVVSTAASRLLYRGRRDPRLGPEEP